MAFERGKPIQSVAILTDSTTEKGYNASQRAFAWYLMSLPQNELEKWRSFGSFTTEDQLDSITLEILIPENK
ncbi:MAG: hypothetical protein ACO29U_09445 [Crocinitomicaceae bacterium]